MRPDTINRLSQPKRRSSESERPPNRSESSRTSVMLKATRRSSQTIKPPIKPRQRKSSDTAKHLDVFQRLSQPKKRPSATRNPVEPSNSGQRGFQTTRELPKYQHKNTRNCAVCMNSMDEVKVCLATSCGHAYCRPCIVAGLRSALSSRELFKCCGTRVSVKNAKGILPPSLIEPYKALVTELTTPNPTYCSKSTCGIFIHPATIKGPTATCPGSSAKTCGARTGKAGYGSGKRKRLEELSYLWTYGK
ncbi:hypothetical protein HYFRA_00009116 [Hymenoscyphus fraxineus]|uniref:RING-type domain-containing protein n=1 Tax=Hymenoscyphus fraxineus TaxID=746836 RepID=A0A9N9KVT1_9HELO|nr:hypothetical protein HYFRA_00009116 [Hymenoscyphus fraxineus]